MMGWDVKRPNNRERKNASFACHLSILVAFLT